MKKGLLLIAIMTAGMVFNQLSAQGLYVKLNTGYGVPASSQNIEDFNNINYSYTGGDYGDETIERVNFSLGQGITIGGNIGWMFNSNFGIDLGLSYLMGGKTEATETELFDSQWYNYTYESKRSISSNMVRFAPSFILVADMLKINPYARFGVIVGKGKINIEMSEEYYEDYDGIYEYNEKSKLELSDGISLGLSAGIGALYNVAGNISVFGELSMISMTYAPEKGKLVEYTRDGEDLLIELQRYEKEILYLDKIEGYYQEPQGDEPRKELKQNLPFGSFGLNFGIRIGF